MKITLDSMRESISKKYAHTEIDFGGSQDLILRNPLRLKKEERDEMLSFQDKIDGADGVEEQIALLSDLIVVVAKEKSVAREYLNLIKDDEDANLFLMETVSQYMEGQQAGEASPSEG